MTVHDDATTHLSEPLGDAVTGTLAFPGGTSDLVLRGEWLAGELYQGRFTGHIPDVETRDGTVTVRYPRRPFNRRRSAELVLNAAVSWAVDVEGGAAGVRADLSRTPVRALTFSGGATDVGLTLGEPSGTVRVIVAGGVTRLAVRRPAGAAVLLRIAKGATDVRLDDQAIGAAGGTLQLATPGVGEAENRYEIDVRGGATSLVIEAG
ncbi:hypothetical protein [Actinoplanes sp. RD1]|uniref:hypothetical protein n=1 Tax=Actinoplanes sp. RD1 TaxID=3064538 RepID=UPI0027413326|nr:hypothetical protein [Actinoplanes sp. RD1]